MAEHKKTKKVKKIIGKKKIPVKKIVRKRKTVKKLSKALRRFPGNPVIHPERNSYWESRATFNPTAFEHDGKVHILYRAIGMGDVSTICYGESRDGYNILGRTFKPVFVSKKTVVGLGNPIFYSSGGGGSGGAEDPRITKIDGRLYMTYTAFDGWGSVRIGLTSISLHDFLNKKWHWKEPVLISPPGEVHKNWVLFPEKIRGKFAILHSLSPEILIEYVKDMNSFDGTKFIKSVHQGDPRWQKREKGIRGVGGAPIKTKYGWLVIFHKTEDGKYKLYAMILDLKDPTKILYRSQGPILEPGTFYEKEGVASNIIYSCGAVVKDGNLFVYYGGADMVSCVAVADMELFLKELITTGKAKLKKGK